MFANTPYNVAPYNVVAVSGNSAILEIVAATMSTVIRSIDLFDEDTLFNIRCSVRENLQTREQLAEVGVTRWIEAGLLTDGQIRFEKDLIL